ncbi:hypothetical protein [Streptomyces sp. SID3212]|uniref:hypothetical protein n=1 Tax=Streptomyces sp. SID3212 TaxID=2690259 RepID=UPI0031F68229
MATHRVETDRTPHTDEPVLRVGGPAPARRGRVRRLLPRGIALLTSVCTLVVLINGHAALPFQRIVTIEAKMASKADYFGDPEVQRLLVRHGIRVRITRMGSREIAAQSYEGYDVVFPSGQPASDQITRKRATEGRPVTAYRPFVSPIVLATYREYAQTLADHAIAEPLPGAPAGAEPLYYRLDMEKFLGATRAGTRWNDLGLRKHGGTHNDNRVLAQTSHICESNSAGTYLGLVSYVDHTVGPHGGGDRGGGGIPRTAAEADAFGRDIKELLNGQGMPASDKNKTYVSPEGKSTSPISVIYEHQFLAHQIRAEARTARVDNERVLLYPSTRFVTEPQLIALTSEGDRLGRLVTDDPALQRRAMELGFRIGADDNSASNSAGEALTRFLSEHHIPVPALSEDDTKAVLPQLPLFERMVELVGDCAPVPQATGPEAP